jgi:hypothetical protein
VEGRGNFCSFRTSHDGPILCKKEERNLRRKIKMYGRWKEKKKRRRGRKEEEGGIYEDRRIDGMGEG